MSGTHTTGAHSGNVTHHKFAALFCCRSLFSCCSLSSCKRCGCLTGNTELQSISHSLSLQSSSCAYSTCFPASREPPLPSGPGELSALGPTLEWAHAALQHSVQHGDGGFLYMFVIAKRNQGSMHSQ
mmetsp:Transcript_39262/g.103523  ORF Transcript_39262/g.103523 Transcript_39262/m.103523 type:complete len:127 (-) Transcript_39262:169-549(-)